MRSRLTSAIVAGIAASVASCGRTFTISAKPDRIEPYYLARNHADTTPKRPCRGSNAASIKRQAKKRANTRRRCRK